MLHCHNPRAIHGSLEPLTQVGFLNGPELLALDAGARQALTELQSRATRRRPQLKPDGRAQVISAPAVDAPLLLEITAGRQR